MSRRNSLQAKALRRRKKTESHLDARCAEAIHGVAKMVMRKAGEEQLTLFEMVEDAVMAGMLIAFKMRDDEDTEMPIIQ